MPVNKAKNHYLGKDGYARMNCAQSVVNAFKDKFNLKMETVEEFRAFGGGRAPEGLCGALYAAKYLFESNAAGEKGAELEKHFQSEAGAVKCREIMATKKLACVGCVEICSVFLEKHEV